MNSNKMDSTKKNNQNERRKPFVPSQLFFSYFSLNKHTLSDLVSTKHHSDDFITTRTSYITTRLWFMCMFFSLSVPVFSFFDFIFFPNKEAIYLLSARIVLSISLLMLAQVLKMLPLVRTVRIVMPLAFLLPMLFFVASMLIIKSIPTEVVPSIFSMMPYFILAMLGLFPLTISGGFFVIFCMFTPFVIYNLVLVNQPFWLFFNDVWLFMLFAGISLWLQVGQLSMLMKLYRESTVDPLTKLINRRVLLRMAQKNDEYHKVYSVVMFDLDRFKRVNDNYGHVVGDKVLVTVANIIKKELRATDIIARFGGEEFVAVLPETKLDDANIIASRVAVAIRQKIITLDDGNELNVTASVGVTQRKQEENLDDALKRADDFLYFAKDNGRDQVICDHDCCNSSTHKHAS
ncbi:MAG: diguanylate cyclase (GGDEF)-like protein [Alteromonadaceae bacterium]|jgi:diguanylate cyclase (GGDEF)-like protein